MKKKTIYKDVPEWDKLNQLSEVEDFLPKPENLVFRPKLKKVTLVLSEDSINFFKQKAEKLNTSYQPMIRNLLDAYVHRFR